AAITAARDAAEHEARDVRNQLADLHDELDRAREATRIAGTEVSERTLERDDAITRRDDLQSRLQDAQHEIEALHESVDMQGSERAAVAEQLGSASQRVTELEQQLEAAEQRRMEIDRELQAA